MLKAILVAKEEEEEEEDGSAMPRRRRRRISNCYLASASNERWHPSIPPTIIPPPLPSALDPRNGTDRHNPVRVIFISLGGELNGKSGEKEGGGVVRRPQSPNHISRIRRKAKTGPLIPPKRTFQKHEVSHSDILQLLQKISTTMSCRSNC